MENILNDLKLKHGKVYTLEVPLDDESEKKATIYLKKPDKSVRGMVTKLAGSGKYDQAVETALKNLYIGGDSLDLILKNDDAMASCEDAIVEILTVQKAVLKKN